MEITNINEYNNMSNYNKTVSSQIPQEQLPSSKITVKEDVDTNIVQLSSEKVENKKSLSVIDLTEVAGRLKGSEPFEMVGKDSDINKLDMEKAISKMQKDSVLQHYQFFIGDKI